MAERYLIDTNVVVNFSERNLQPAARAFVVSVIDSEFCLSVINKIELLGFSVQRNDIVELVDAAEVIGLTDAVVEKTIAIRRSKRIKLPDAIIAATCIMYSLTLLTRNVADFNGIKGLKVIDPNK